MRARLAKAGLASMAEIEQHWTFIDMAIGIDCLEMWSDIDNKVSEILNPKKDE